MSLQQSPVTISVVHPSDKHIKTLQWMAVVYRDRNRSWYYIKHGKYRVRVSLNSRGEVTLRLSRHDFLQLFHPERLN